MMDPGRVKSMVECEADIAFARRIRTVFDWIPEAPSGRFLDLSCGRGFYLKLLRDAGVEELVGVDLDAEVLRRAQGAPGGSQVEVGLCRADALHLPFTDGSFSTVLFSEGLEHLKDDRSALVEMRRVMAPGARAIITVPHANYPFLWDPLNFVLERTTGSPIRTGPLAGIWANHERLYTRDQFRALVSDAGLEVEAERSFGHHCFPFSHNLVYGLGKPILDSGILPDSLAAAADRTQFGRPRGPLNPMRLALRLFTWPDAWNRMDEPPGRSVVSLAILCRKPGRLPSAQSQFG